MKRIIIALIICGMALSSLAACSSGTEVAESTASASETAESSGETAESSTETEQTTEADIPDDLPEMDFEGYKFRIGAAEGEMYGSSYISKVYVEEATGDVVNDAVYSANSKVEERYNIEMTPMIYEDIFEVKKGMYAGDDVFDIITGHDINMGNASLEGIFRNVRELPYLDFSKPWWPSYSVDSLTVGDCMYLMSNYVSYLNLAMTRVVFVNRQIVDNYGLDMPYDMVRDGSWTLDEYISMCSNIYEDLNGDGARDINDRYGFATNYYLYAVQESFGIKSIVEDKDGTLSLNINNEKTVDMIEKMHSLLYDTSGGYITTDNDITGVKMFANDQSLFSMVALGEAPASFRDSEVEYGIVPIPKFDENQENYISGSTDRPFAVPVTAVNDELIGIIFEAMSAEGYKQVRPAFFDIALKNKFTYDTDSSEMLDIIGSTIVLDFSYIYSNFGGYAFTLMNMLEPGNDSTDFASYYEKNLPSAQKQLETIQAAFDKMAG